MPTSTGSFTGDNAITLAGLAELLMQDYILGEEGVFVYATVSSLGDFVGDDTGVFAKTGLFFGAGLSASARAVRAMRCQEDTDRVDLAGRVCEEAECLDLVRWVPEDVVGGGVDSNSWVLGGAGWRRGCELSLCLGYRRRPTFGCYVGWGCQPHTLDWVFLGLSWCD